eukprot:1146041-Pelagomonas_calceolata.AAC.15
MCVKEGTVSRTKPLEAADFGTEEQNLWISLDNQIFLFPESPTGHAVNQFDKVATALLSSQVLISEPTAWCCTYLDRAFRGCAVSYGLLTVCAAPLHWLMLMGQPKAKASPSSNGHELRCACAMRGASGINKVNA